MINVSEITIEEFENNIYNRYIKLFPEKEQRDWDKIEKAYQDGIEHFYKISLDDMTIGFIILGKLKNNPYYLDYFAIYDEYQSKGYGSQSLKSLLENIVHNDGLILEIEKVDDSIIQTKKRYEFYKRLGFREVDSEYMLYDVHFTPMVNSPDITKKEVDEVFLKYYLINLGKEDAEKHFKIIK